MKSKTLLAMAVASTFGLSAATFAGPTIGPISVDDNAPWLSHQLASSSLSGSLGTGVTSSHAGGTLSSEEHAALSMETDSLALAGEDADVLVLLNEDADVLALADQGIYSDFYRVSFTPVALEQWDYYVISPISGDEYAASDETYFFTPFDVVFFTIDDSAELSESEMTASMPTDAIM